MANFRTNSYWETPKSETATDNTLVDPASTASTGITGKQIEDWSLRLQAMADEAHDEHLGPLESNLLDLRDELLYELHRGM